jgi:hypothetical protein
MARYPGAEADFEAALAIDRRLAAADPSDGLLQRQSIYQLSMLAALPGAKVRWSDVVTAWTRCSPPAPPPTSPNWTWPGSARRRRPVVRRLPGPNPDDRG